MASFLDFTYECLYHLNQYFKASWPVRLLFGSHLKPPSHGTELKVLRVIDLLRHKKDPQESSIVKLVNELPVDENILCVKDQVNGYNLLQLAVINGRKDILVLLAKSRVIRYHSKCSPPLHLAAHLGYEGLLEILLKNGADVCEIGGLCYPGQHQAVKYSKWMGLLDRPVFACQKEPSLPVFCAISENNIGCVKILLTQMTEQGIPLPLPSVLLHFSCHKGSADCIEYFCKKFPEEVNSIDNERDTPLLAAVGWGQKCVRILIEHGADARGISKLGETALHRLYRNDIDGLFTIYDTTKFLLTTGLEQMINEVNNEYETPLHVLVTHVGFIGGHLLHKQDDGRHVSRSEMQTDYQEQVIGTLQLLLQFNADPDCENRLNLTPINKLLHIALKSSFQQQQAAIPCICDSIDAQYLYKNNFGYIKKAVEVLLKHGSNPNSQCQVGHTPLILILQCLSEMDIEDICLEQNGILETIEILLCHGAETNFMYIEQGTCSTLLSEIASRYFAGQRYLPAIKEDMLAKYAQLVNQVLELMLKYGMNPNHVSRKKRKHLQGGSGNALIDFVRLAQQANTTSDFAVIRLWLLTLFQWGADPDLEPYASEPIICHSQSSIFLKHQGTQALNHYIYEVKEFDSLLDDGHAQDLLLLFYNTMNHCVLYDCLSNARFMARFHPLGATGHDFVKLLTRLSENPRSLKEIARVSIYVALQRNLARRVPELPLPNPMKNYLLEIQ
ncbi:ankyrin-2-like [Ylistrum balloti]|uniref:ankyrin-2-like n=1 Tax=Ylistrum balloti TaxID=509963 RepID=UPI002905EEF6|nr:ankyrin-2-like [Ylistrum balloti]XP_060077967.1 ankyrin-2-like [Ylistrum balloti]